MRKLIVLFVVLYLSTLHGHAQFFGGGLTGGVNVSQIDGDGSGGYNKLGFIAGGYITYDFTPKIMGIMELKYNQKGSVKNANVDAGETDYLKRVLDYVQLPVMLDYNLGAGFSAEIGIGLGYLVSTRFYDAYGRYPNDQLSYEFNSFELSSIIGVKYHINERWFVNARWSASFLPVANVLSNNIGNAPGASPWEQAGTQYNRTLEFCLGYRLGKGVKKTQ